MVYQWEDLQSDHLEVEWGENIHGTRRARTLGLHEPKRSNWVSALIVGSSTLAAIGMAAMVAMTLSRSAAHIPNREGNPSNVEGLGASPVSIPEALLATALPTTSVPTTSQPTGRPTWRPTLAGPAASPPAHASSAPSATASARPSRAASASPSASPSSPPSGVPRAPPAPVPGPCADRAGVFRNHAGDKVPCAWFSTVGTYNFEKNCERTEVGRACVLTCRKYNDCVLSTAGPSRQPSSAPSSSTPTVAPTPEPPKSITLGATGDASVNEAVPKANVGSASWLKIDAAPLPLPQDMTSPNSGSGGGAFHVLLRFDLSEHDSQRPVESAVLRLKAANSCSSGGYLERTHSPHWNEETVGWDTAPEGDGTEIGRLGIINSGFWMSVDIPPAVLHHGTLSLRLYPDALESCLFVSKENPGGGGPELHIIYDDV